MNPGILFGWFPILGLAAGLARARYPRLPLIVAALIVLAYGAYLLSSGIWAARCWDCAYGTQGIRSDAFLVGAVFFGVLAAATLIGIALGARLTVVLRKLFGTVRELREGDGRAAD
jgi:hypothetical protein